MQREEVTERGKLAASNGEGGSFRSSEEAAGGGRGARPRLARGRDPRSDWKEGGNLGDGQMGMRLRAATGTVLVFPFFFLFFLTL